MSWINFGKGFDRNAFMESAVNANSNRELIEEAIAARRPAVEILNIAAGNGAGANITDRSWLRWLLAGLVLVALVAIFVMLKRRKSRKSE